MGFNQRGCLLIQSKNINSRKLLGDYEFAIPTVYILFIILLYIKLLLSLDTYNVTLESTKRFELSRWERTLNIDFVKLNIQHSQPNYK